MPDPENPIPALSKEEFSVLRLFRAALYAQPLEQWPDPSQFGGERSRGLLLNALDEEVQRRLEIGAAADLDVLQVRYPGVVPDVIRAVLAYRQKNIGTQTHQRPANVGDIRVPGYEILGELGRGGMGVVFRAVQVLSLIHI